MHTFPKTRLRSLVFLAVGGLASCALLEPADDPVLAKLDELERRMQAVERVVRNQTIVDMTQQVASIERQSAELRGRVEAIENDAGVTASRQRQLYADLDARIQALEASIRSLGSGVMEPGGGDAAALPVPGGSDRENYQAAFDLLKAQSYEEAGAAFREFLVVFPDSELADNAQYWLAESFYVTQQYTEALAAFQTVVVDYPLSRKLPDALLKIGYCHYELKQYDEARESLRQVISDHSESTAARLAGQRLERMEEEGV